MIAIDANLLIYAHRNDSPWHEQAYACVSQVAEGVTAWAMPWQCIHEFLSIVTHPRIYSKPSSVDLAIDAVEAWLESPSLVVLTETPDHWQHLTELLRTGRARGPLVHDARIAALCIQHGVTELWTADRDFGRFLGLKIRNPLVG